MTGITIIGNTSDYSNYYPIVIGLGIGLILYFGIGYVVVTVLMKLYNSFMKGFNNK